MNADIQNYFENGSEEQQALFTRLQDLILKMYPAAEMKISYQIPTYFVPTGKVFLGYWKDGVSVYTGYPEKIDEFKAKHPGIKTGKGSINFKLTDKIPLADLKQLVKFAMEAKKK